MPEPTSTTTATVAAVTTVAAASPTISMLTIYGVNLGLRPDILIAGFSGALVAIVLLSSVPNEGDTWQHLIRTTIKRMFVSLASSLTAGYITPLLLLPIERPHESVLLATAFSVGAGAQKVLRWAIDRVTPSTPIGGPKNGGQA